MLKNFRTQVARHWFKALAQRSQRRPTWAKLAAVFEHWLPIPQVKYDFPDRRFDASRLKETVIYPKTVKHPANSQDEITRQRIGIVLPRLRAMAALVP